MNSTFHVFLINVKALQHETYMGNRFYKSINVLMCYICFLYKLSRPHYDVTRMMTSRGSRGDYRKTDIFQVSEC
jgi:hypothetical protein